MGISSIMESGEIILIKLKACVKRNNHDKAQNAPKYSNLEELSI